MSIVEETDRYETWLREQCDIVEEGLQEKHRLMALDPFRFLRATCYRFARKLPKWCPEFNHLVRVPSVGDAHVDNFGTWRDAEGRLVWGANDFDEAAVLPFAYDLVRLGVSARLSTSFNSPPDARCTAILEGYTAGLERPAPTFVDREVSWMRMLLEQPAAQQGKFLRRMAKLQKITPSEAVAAALTESLPAGALLKRFAMRQKGGGSLGRPRIVAIACWRGGLAVREAKALVPSAWAYAAKREDLGLSFLAVATSRFRSSDPFLRYGAGCIVRRIAADSRKIDLGALETVSDERAVLRTMGSDLAAIHAGGRRSGREIAADVAAQPRRWLETTCEDIDSKVRADHNRWKIARGAQFHPTWR